MEHDAVIRGVGMRGMRARRASCIPSILYGQPCMPSVMGHMHAHTGHMHAHTNTLARTRVFTHARIRTARRQGNPSPPSLPSFLLVWYTLLQSSLKSIVTSTPGARELLLQQVRATLGALRMCF